MLATLVSKEERLLVAWVIVWTSISLSGSWKPSPPEHLLAKKYATQVRKRADLPEAADKGGTVEFH